MTGDIITMESIQMTLKLEITEYPSLALAGLAPQVAHRQTL